ncbi:MAG: carboxyl transferase domain-containing protein [Pseudomonadota bacterium]
MSWQDEVEEIEQRRQLRAAMGGPEGIERQRKRGKLTVRERVAALVDDDGFEEFYSLAGEGRYDEANALVEFVPRASVDGMAKIGGRKVVLTAGDFTVRGGSGGTGGGLGAELPPNERASRWQLPLVRLLDAAGGSVRGFEEMGRTYLPDGNIWSAVDARLLSEVPVVAAVLGSVAGLPAINACLAHFNVMVKDTSQLFPGGPPVVKAALGYDISKEDLGGPQIHTRISGVVDNLANTEAEAFDMVRCFLSYLPSSVHELPPRVQSNDPAQRADDSLLTAMPRDRRKIYNAKKILEAIVDRDSFFEIAPNYGRARMLGLARIDGYPVGIMINNPKFNGGSTDVAAGSKVMRLLQLCDVFHLPLISLADEPGFMVGLESEKQGIERAGAALVAQVCATRMPWLTVVMGRLYGVAGQCHHRPDGMFRRYAWPSASWGSMHIAGGASAAYRREIDSAPDPAAKRAEIEARLNALGSPFRTAEATGQDIIDPRATRRLAAEFVADAQRVLTNQLGAPPAPYRP